MTTRLLTFRVFTFRRLIFSALGIYVVSRGVMQHDWISLLLGAAILVFGWLTPG
jgi:hypothetical protein